MQSEAIAILKTRRSVRAFKSDPIDEAVIRDIIDCARMAATAINLQPWEFVVVRDAERRRRVADITDHGKFIAQAPVCVAVFCKECKYYLEDGSAAIQNLLNAAWAYGVATCWVAGDKKPYCPQIGAVLKAPSGTRLVGLVAMGYPAQPPQMPSKRPLDDLLHWETF